MIPHGTVGKDEPPSPCRGSSTGCSLAVKGHVRPLLRRVHLWLGLSLGVMFALLGLTGSALVFYVEIDAALNGPVETQQPPQAGAGWDSPLWDRALQAGRARFRDPQGNWSFEVTGEGGAIPARYYPASGHHSHHDHREMVWFSADGTRVIRSAPWGGYLMSWLYELHANLLIDETGRQIAGWSGFVILVLLITGVMAWWPRGSWRKALVFKRGKTTATVRPNKCAAIKDGADSFIASGFGNTWLGIRPPEGIDYQTFAMIRWQP